ncbi:hypothetical protein SAMN02745673_04912 [Marinactinospora thermotolerans DSM 45154]|uniref:Uncharacterized protein n=1 Tax=Marinactinospora thermotolerans DSM 45154 TaxID=1122192 RepID=A0A1T4TFF0_9ACTN|nr:phosphotransferase [Marinactinospora thermotolerans]SKA39008.1 hypothetical protein SAMN02745673_04912 [Marinactinospora thermotolerans DSM 45154]
MQQPEIDRLRKEVFSNFGCAPSKVEVLHSWELSHVERVTLSTGGTLVFKAAVEPFVHEHDALTSAWQAGVNVPRVYSSTRGPTSLGMLMEDLGRPVREADDADGIAAALQLHSSAVPDFLPLADTAWLASLPSRALRSLRLLQRARWTDAHDIADTLQEIEKASMRRAEGAMRRPYGWVHSEFHPESLLVTRNRTFVFDFARAFRGPGLIDLASWHGTVDPPDVLKTRGFLETYVHEGGPAETLNDRGGLSAEEWALGWHRMWVLTWFIDQSLTWIGDPDDDELYVEVVRRHTNDAARLLRV